MIVSRSRIALLIETVVAFMTFLFAAKVVVLGAGLVGLTIPAMPLLRRTYLAFAVVLLIILWLRRRGEALAQFGLNRPKNLLLAIGLGIVLAIVQIVATETVRAVTTPFIVEWTGANPHLAAQAFAALRGNLELFVLILPCVWLFAAFGEEFIFRGYLMTRIAQILGESRTAWWIAIVAQAVLFSLAHWYQGPVGMVPIAIGGVITGVASWAWGRTLWPAVIAHGLIDTLGFTQLFLGQPIS